MTRRSLLPVALLAVAACRGTAPAPSGFGVDLTVTLTPAARAVVQSVKLHVSGAETYDVPAIPVSAFPGRTARVHYIPGVQSGTLTFAATGLSASSAEVAFGSSGGVVLVSGKAASASITVDTGSEADMAVGDLSGTDLLGIDAAGDALPPGPPVLTLDNQPTYDFGTVLVNTQSSVATLTVTNTGATVSSPLNAATLSGIGASAYSIQTDHCMQTTLAPNATCTVLVVLGPTAVGTPMATLKVSAALGGTAMVGLTGSVVTPGAITLSVTPSASPVVTLPSGTAQLSVTVMNSGGVATGGISWGFTGNASTDYTVVGGTCTVNQVLSASASCGLTVQFAPTVAGTRNATLTITAVPGGPGVLALSGTALTPSGCDDGDHILANGICVDAVPAGDEIGILTDGTGGANCNATSTNYGNYSPQMQTPSFADCSGCTCTGKVSCALNLSFYPSPGCAGTAITLPIVVTSDGTCQTIAGGPTTVNLSTVKVGAATPTDSCTSGADPSPPGVVWQVSKKYCGVTNTTPLSCGVNRVCVPAPPASQKLCVRIPNTGQACPSGFGAAPADYFGGTNTDTRTCSCGCNVATAGSCASGLSGDTIELYDSSADCTNGNNNGQLFEVAAGTCQALSGGIEFWASPIGATAAGTTDNVAPTCTPTNSTSGTPPTANAGSTICCQP